MTLQLEVNDCQLDKQTPYSILGNTVIDSVPPYLTAKKLSLETSPITYSKCFQIVDVSKTFDWSTLIDFGQLEETFKIT